MRTVPVPCRGHPCPGQGLENHPHLLGSILGVSRIRLVRIRECEPDKKIRFSLLPPHHRINGILASKKEKRKRQPRTSRVPQLHQYILNKSLAAGLLKWQGFWWVSVAVSLLFVAIAIVIIGEIVTRT